MADVADIANDVEQERIARILSNRPQPTDQPSAIDCKECDLPITEARRIALPGVQTCVHCQEINEQRFKFHH
ncbi:TraR/DksA family transcriptional regulator [Cellvibrio mixtus]|uniref:TraR/DksA family transcriptional regulator n=1 Tax=Cellvibrio mixtus TaxID=39650 RepID=UPI0005868378|nr:TraR/DksA family transcriptional regulator [Cellvibrio mixtus]